MSIYLDIVQATDEWRLMEETVSSCCSPKESCLSGAQVRAWWGACLPTQTAVPPLRESPFLARRPFQPPKGMLTLSRFSPKMMLAHRVGLGRICPPLTSVRCLPLECSDLNQNKENPQLCGSVAPKMLPWSCEPTF